MCGLKVHTNLSVEMHVAIHTLFAINTILAYYNVCTLKTDKSLILSLKDRVFMYVFIIIRFRVTYFLQKKLLIRMN